MAFGIPNSDSGSGGEFLGRIQYDARSGTFKIVKRILGAEGYTPEEGLPSPTTQFAIDFGSLEVGYSKIASPPVFMVVPYGQPLPPQPEEMGMPDPKTGRTTKAFKPCFRAKVCSPGTFGDMDPYYFSSNSKGVLNSIDVLHQQFMASPEAAQGKIPVIHVARSTAIKTTGKFGTSTNYAPDCKITQWIDRPEVFGERSVAPPARRAATFAPAASAAPPAVLTHQAPPPNHVGPPPANFAPPPVTETAGFDTKAPF